MKRKIFFVLFLLFCVNIFAQEYKVEKNEDGDWIFNTTFQVLYNKKIWEEIQIQKKLEILKLSLAMFLNFCKLNSDFYFFFIIQNEKSIGIFGFVMSNFIFRRM